MLLKVISLLLTYKKQFQFTWKAVKTQTLHNKVNTYILMFDLCHIFCVEVWWSQNLKKAPLIQLACCIPSLTSCFFLGSLVTSEVLSNLHHEYPICLSITRYIVQVPRIHDSLLVAIYLSCKGHLCRAQAALLLLSVSAICPRFQSIRHAK